MTGPVRIQLQRRAGWRMPPNTVKVDRTTKWGNPFAAAGNPDKVNPDTVHAQCVDRYRTMLERAGRYILPATPQFFGQEPTVEEIQRDLRGKNLACWCHPDSPCHADVLLEIANA